MVAAGSDFDELLELIASASARADLSERDVTLIPASLTPLPLPDDSSPSNP
jgi:hypothetical protein